MTAVHKNWQNLQIFAQILLQAIQKFKTDHFKRDLILEWPDFFSENARLKGKFEN